MPFLGQVWPATPDPILLVSVAVILSLTYLVVRPTERALVDWAVSLSMALYLGGFMLFYMPLRARRRSSRASGSWRCWS